MNPFQKGVCLYLFAGLATMLGIITVQVIGGFYYQDQLDLTTQETARMISLSLMISGVAMIVTQGLQMKKLKWPPKAMILIGAVLLMASMLLLLFTGSLISYFIAFFLFGVGTGLMMPGFMAGASLAVSREQQGGVAGLVSAVQGIAAMISPILSTPLYRVDKHIPFALIGIIVLLMALVVLGTRDQPLCE